MNWQLKSKCSQVHPQGQGGFFHICPTIAHCLASISSSLFSSFSVFIPSLSHIVEPTRQVLLRTRYDEANPDKVFLIVRNNEKNHIKWNETWNSSLGLFAWWTRGFTRLRFPSMRAGALTFQRCKKQQMRQIYLCYFFQLVLIFGSFWVIFGPFWQFWVIFGPIWAILGHFWAIFGC